jgi:hypothetical protein
MVQANIDNTPISIDLQENESTTVPTGETWVVTLTIQNGASVAINGTLISATWTGSGENNTDSTETTVVAGDTLKCISGDSNSSGFHIGGFKV